MFYYNISVAVKIFTVRVSVPTGIEAVAIITKNRFAYSNIEDME